MPAEYENPCLRRFNSTVRYARNPTNGNLACKEFGGCRRSVALTLESCYDGFAYSGEQSEPNFYIVNCRL